MIGILLTVLVAALVYLLLAAPIARHRRHHRRDLVPIAGIPSAGFGFGSRWGDGRGTV